MNKIKNIFNIINKTRSKQGLRGMYILSNKHLFKYLRYFHAKLFKSNKKFKFKNKEYNYFFHIYNFSWENERTIEVPIVLNIIKKFKGKRILEVGNVLSHYTCFEHDIVDKYEKSKRVINEDIIYFKSKEKYDLIVSISTLEHVGWDEKPQQKDKISLAIKNLKKLIKSKGKIVVTIPLGHNLYFDGLIRKGKDGFKEKYFLKRISKENLWKEVKKEDIGDTDYGKPFPYANVVFVGIS